MKILFLVTEDWFFRSHFLGFAHRAIADGHEVIVAARMSGVLDGEPGIRCIDTRAARRAMGPFALANEISRTRALIDRERPDVVHAIALKPIVLLLLSGARNVGRVLALTGRGYLSMHGSLRRRAMSAVLRRMLRSALDAPRTVLAVENAADRAWVEGGRRLDDARVVTPPGAGVDASALSVEPEPAGPIVVGLAARLIQSKGVDVVVDAIARLRVEGRDISLRIAGDQDHDNPEHVSDAEIARWRATPGVELLGRVRDINAFWASVHIACLASRGGEGLPRSIIEAAASGRPVVTTQTPGCEDFVRDAQCGIPVPVDDVAATAAAIAQLADDPEQRRKLGAAGRARVEAAYTIAHAADAAAQAWARVR
jgi:glycosyltransferase involved in cell wall biosynthesis